MKVLAERNLETARAAVESEADVAAQEQDSLRRDSLRQVRRIVVKIGSSTLTAGNGELDLAYLDGLAGDIAGARRDGREMLLVTSGAVAAGRSRVGGSGVNPGWVGDRKPFSVTEKQALAAIGQGLLMQAYERFFSARGLTVAQVLLTRSDVSDRRRYLNCRNTLLQLLSWGVTPIINENDTVASEEIRFGDNDTLSALVAGLVDADLLLILSDTDGLYTSDPRIDPGAKLMRTIKRITPEIVRMAGGPGTGVGTGGMSTKINSAKIAAASGVQTVIAPGRPAGAVSKVLAGEEIGTLILASSRRLGGRDRWLRFGAGLSGRITIDGGARRAILEGGKSLLPSGIVDIEGRFEPGQTVSIVDQAKVELARGISNYAADEVAKIRGKKTLEIESILGYKYSDEVVHRDNMVLTGEGSGRTTHGYGN